MGVVEGHVTAGNRNTHHLAGVSQTGNGLHQLPHGVRVFGGTKVQAVGYRQRAGTNRAHVTVGLSQGLGGAGSRVKLGETPVSVSGDSHTQAGLFIHTHHTGVVGLRQGGLTAHETVVLVGNPAGRGVVGVKRNSHGVGR